MRSPPRHAIPPPLSYPGPACVRLPDRGTALVSDAIDRFLVRGGIASELAGEPYRLSGPLQASAPYVLAACNAGRVVFNGDVVGMRGDPLPAAEAVGLVRKLAEELAYAHGMGVVHRDVKPANVMIDERGEPLSPPSYLGWRAVLRERLSFGHMRLLGGLPSGRSRGGTVPSYQIQVLWDSEDPPTPADEAQAYAFRDKVAAAGFADARVLKPF